MNSPLPAGVAASGVTFDFDFADDANSAERPGVLLLRGRSGGRRAPCIGTHGSAAAPVACQAHDDGPPDVHRAARGHEQRHRQRPAHPDLRRPHPERRARCASTAPSSPAPRPSRRSRSTRRRFTDAADSTPADGAVADRDRRRRRPADQLELADGVQHGALPEGRPSRRICRRPRRSRPRSSSTPSARRPRRRTACFYFAGAAGDDGPRDLRQRDDAVLRDRRRLHDEHDRRCRR